jgi:4-hydroxy-4-methyl-2-oxoglutarate aldolase
VVNPGDIVVGDRDGVVVIEREKALHVLGEAQKKAKHEVEIRKLLLEGKTTLEIFNFSKLK